MTTQSVNARIPKDVGPAILGARVQAVRESAAGVLPPSAEAENRVGP